MTKLHDVVLLDGEVPVMLMSNMGIMFLLLMGCGAVAFGLMAKLIITGKA